MFVTSVDITNYKLFKTTFSMDFNVPDKKTKGSGITILCGENGNGKTSIFEAIALAMQDYRSENFSIENINDINQDTEIKVHTADFLVVTVLPKGNRFRANGFHFKANKRKRATSDLYGSLIVSGRKLLSDEVDKEYELKCETLTPWGNPRYEQPAFLFLDRNRIYQTRKGNTSLTNFDYVIERLCLEPQKAENENAEYILSDKHPLKRAFADFERAFHIPLKLYKTNPEKQMENAFVASVTNDNIIKLNNLGSGYEMFFSILWAIYRSFDENKDLTILLDEPELHLHPRLQMSLIHLLMSFSDKVQIIIATHSPLFIKQLYGINPKFHILEKEEGVPVTKDIKEQKITDYVSLNEINFMAFGLYTEEYFNELYECLQRKSQEIDNSIVSQLAFDSKILVEDHGLVADKPYRADNDSKKVSYITFVRNIIHHRVAYEQAGLTGDFDEELRKSVDKLREFL